MPVMRRPSQIASGAFDPNFFGRSEGFECLSFGNCLNDTTILLFGSFVSWKNFSLMEFEIFF